MAELVVCAESCSLGCAPAVGVDDALAPEGDDAPPSLAERIGFMPRCSLRASKTP